MIEAAKKIAGATDGSEVKIGEVGTANNKGAAANQESVNGIADGMKEIVDAGGKDALKAAAAAGGADNKEAGKLFGGTAGNAGADDDDIGKAAAAVNAVSGEQILKAIVDAAAGGNKVGAAAGAATNPIAAAIGTNDAGADFGAGGMNNSSDKIAAAIVLRGMAKDGKFSLAAQDNAQKAKVKSVVHQKKMIEAAKKIAGATDGEVKIGEVGTEANKGAAADQASVNGIADGMKEIVDAGGKDALKAGAAGAGADNKEAGKLFGGTNAGNAGANDNDIGKAAAAVNAVSGEQILKAIVDAAAGGDNKVVGAAAGAATNPIAAAIGTDAAQGADFGAGGMNNSSEKIAAAIVLRGMAKDGKFSLAAHNNNNQKAKVKSEDGRGCKEDCGGY